MKLNISRPRACKWHVTSLLSALFTISSMTAAAAEQSASCFRILDALLYDGKPSLASYGLRPVTVTDVTRAEPVTQWVAGVPGVSAMRRWLNAQGKMPELVVLDVERWALSGEPAVTSESLRRFRLILERVKTIDSRPIGFYGVPPIRDYWRAISANNSARYLEWQRANDVWAPLAAEVDVLFPSLYTFYNDQSGWVRYAEANLSEARRLAHGKPVYAFLWPEYHESNKEMRGRAIPAAFWRLQLQTVLAKADGVVIWGGFRKKWDRSAPWWQETQEFAKAESGRLCRRPLPPSQIRTEQGANGG